MVKKPESETVGIANILVIDDEEVMRNLLTDVLTDAGYKITVAASGEEAVHVAKNTSFEVVIVDLKMAGMTGLEVLKRFKQIDTNICVIVMTAYASVESAVEAMRQGAYDYVTKPFNVEEMKVIVARAMERRFLLREAEEKEVYRQLSITDGLTALYNHRYFHEVLTREVARADRYPKPLSLLIIDIDDFKGYNDINGHLAGDRVLRDISRIFMSAARKVDLVARYGGEEFAIILPETDKEGAVIVAKHIRSMVEQNKFEHEDVLTSKNLTVSIGVATYPLDAQSKDQLIQKADGALYEAKHQGKNKVCAASNEPAS